MIEPVAPFQRGKLDALEAAPGAPPMDDLSLVEAVDGLGEGIVVGVADAADRRLDTGFGEALDVADRDVLNAAVAMVDETTLPDRPPIVEGLFQRIEDEVPPRRS